MNEYFMESEREAARLHLKDDVGEAEKQIKAAGLLSVADNAVILDVGTGVGVCSQAAVNVFGSSKKTGCVISLDRSFTRLIFSKSQIRTTVKRRIRRSRLCADAFMLPVKDNSVDFIVCRFLLEYLPDYMAVIRECKRVLKPGGILSIGDLDCNCLIHYPISELMEKQLLQISSVLTRLKLWDPFMGRKLYAAFCRAGMVNNTVTVCAHHVFAGRFPDNHLQNWRYKLEAVKRLAVQHRLTLGFSIEKFAASFIALLKNNQRFSYTPLIIVVGRKKHD